MAVHGAPRQLCVDLLPHTLLTAALHAVVKGVFGGDSGKFLPAGNVIFAGTYSFEAGDGNVFTSECVRFHAPGCWVPQILRLVSVREIGREAVGRSWLHRVYVGGPA